MVVRVTLCGDLAVEVDGERREGRLRGRHGRMLLVYLVLNRGRAVSRSELVEALWGENLPGDPSASLRAHLSRLRSMLGVGAVEGTAQLRLRLPPDARVDIEEAASSVERAESAAAKSRWRECVDEARAGARIATDPLAPGLDAEWIAEARVEVQRTCLRSLELIAGGALELVPVDASSAELAARTLVQRAPFRESGHRLLLRALLENGEAAEGLRAFDSVRTLFRDELGIVPSAPLRALHADLLDATHVAEPRDVAGWRIPHRLAKPGPLVGRVPELVSIMGRVETGELTIVEGEAGVGKTRLLAATAAELRAQGWAVLYGRCERDAPIPYQPLVEALDGVVEALGEPAVTSFVREAGPSIAPLLPVLALRYEEPSAAAASELWRLYRAAERFIAQVAAELPVLIAIDDLHLADRATLGLVGHLGVTARQRTAILATSRSTEARTDSPLSELAERVRAGGGTIHLEGLGREDLAALLVGRSGKHPSPGLVDAVHAATGGNPLYAVQLARHLMESEADPSLWRQEAGASLPVAVRGLVGRRVALMPETVQSTLSIAAVIGREFDLDPLVRVSRRPRLEVLDDLAVALRAGVVRRVSGDSEGLSFVHALIHQALYEGQPAARREECHSLVAEELEARGAGPAELARLAYHWGEAGPLAEPERVVVYSRRAAEQASSRLAFEGAAVRYRRAVEVGVDVVNPAELTDLLLALSRTERQIGALSAARAAARRAGDLARRTGDPPRLARAALSYAAARTTLAVDAFDMEHAVEAVALLGEAHEALPAFDSLLRVRLVSELAAQRLGDLGIDERRALAWDAAAMATRLGDERGELLALQAGTAPSLVGPDGLEETIAAARRATSIARDLHDPSAEWDLRRSLAGACFVAGEIDAMDEQLGLMKAMATAFGDATDALALAVLKAGRARFAGRMIDAERIRNEAMAAAPDPAPAAIAFGAQGWMPLWDAGRYREVIGAVEAIVEQAPQALPLHGLLAMLHCEAGQPAMARERFELVAAEGFPFAHDEFLLIGLTQTALACSYLGDRDRAVELHRLLLPYAALNGAIGEQCLTNGPVALCLGALEVTLDRFEEARRSLVRAEVLARAWGDPSATATVMVHLGRLRVMRGEPEAGARSTAEGIELGRSLGVGRIAVLAERLQEWWRVPQGFPA